MVDNIEGSHHEALNNYYNCTNAPPSGNKAGAAAGGSGTSSGDDGGGATVAVKEQDRLLPIANVGRIMKQILPSNAKISKEAKETMQECASEFISFVTGEASDKCHKEKRKTVNGDDLCWALGNLGFDDYAEPLKRYLYKFREVEGERANQNKNGNNNNNNNINIHHDHDNDDQERPNNNIDDDDDEPRSVVPRNSTVLSGTPTPIEFNLWDENRDSFSGRF